MSISRNEHSSNLGCVCPEKFLAICHGGHQNASSDSHRVAAQGRLAVPLRGEALSRIMAVRENFFIFLDFLPQSLEFGSVGIVGKRSVHWIDPTRQTSALKMWLSRLRCSSGRTAPIRKLVRCEIRAKRVVGQGAPLLPGSIRSADPYIVKCGINIGSYVLQMRQVFSGSALYLLSVVLA